ncbi:MAG: ABC transporter substrate-binding protein [Campylobacterales bacterium]|nr:ABC transporter substrate-binding protein [Campylobacterales bacterium]
MIKINKLLKILLLLAIFSIPSFALRQNEIEPVMQSKINKVLTVLKKKESNTIRGQEIIRTLDPVFDYGLMAKLALSSKTWGSITPAQQKEFSRLFIARLKQSYLDKLDLYNNQKVIYKGVKPYLKGRLQLQTEVIGKDETYKINYNFHNSNNSGNWLIYDVELAGVSIIQTYRQQFAGLLKEKSFNEILTQLRENQPLKTKQS